MEWQNTLPEDCRKGTLGGMTAVPHAARATTRKSGPVTVDAPTSNVHIRLRIDDPERQAKLRTALERIRLGNH